MIDAYIALGSNLDDPLCQVELAIQNITSLAHCQLIKQSSWYRSRAVGPGEQADYINGVVKIRTSQQPEQLLDALLTIETRQGRVRNTRWGPRTLDLDILLYGQEITNDENLQIPHPRMLERNFVLYPLFDVEPGLIIPGNGPLAHWINKSDQNGLEKIQK
jgi:2-amino-4-hydroxy-6-hydroxymethyldihydropteridine diphosphokinase